MQTDRAGAVQVTAVQPTVCEHKHASKQQQLNNHPVWLVNAQKWVGLGVGSLQIQISPHLVIISDTANGCSFLKKILRSRGGV